MQKKTFFKDSLIVGFALFAMFFGAGNIIFPPTIGLVAGKSWLSGFFFYYMADIGLAIVAIYALVKTNKIDHPAGLMERLGTIPGIMMMGAAIVCIGPLLAIPRTATVSYEVGGIQLLGASTEAEIGFIMVFYIVTFLLAVKESKLVDIVGKYLTPVLVLGLSALIIWGVIHPIGALNPVVQVDNLIYKSVMDGYQTLDVLAALVFGLIVVNSLKNRGYTSEKDKFIAVMSAGTVAGVVLLFIYGGLCYLGATLSSEGLEIGGEQVRSQADLVILIAKLLFGSAGGFILGITVLLACLTTAIALVGSVGTFFSTVSKGKLKYEVICAITCLFSIVIANYGLNTILKISVPILTIVYPAALVTIVLSLFDNHIKNDNVFKIAALFALIISILEVSGVNVQVIPLGKAGFAWVIPTLVGIVIGSLIPNKKNKNIEAK